MKVVEIAEVALTQHALSAMTPAVRGIGELIDSMGYDHCRIEIKVTPYSKRTAE